MMSAARFAFASSFFICFILSPLACPAGKFLASKPPARSNSQPVHGADGNGLGKRVVQIIRPSGSRGKSASSRLPFVRDCSNHQRGGSTLEFSQRTCAEFSRCPPTWVSAAARQSTARPAPARAARIALARRHRARDFPGRCANDNNCAAGTAPLADDLDLMRDFSGGKFCADATSRARARRGGLRGFATPPVEQHGKTLFARRNRPVKLRREIIHPAVDEPFARIGVDLFVGVQPVMGGGIPGRQMPNGLMPNCTHGFAALMDCDSFWTNRFTLSRRQSARLKPLFTPYFSNWRRRENQRSCPAEFFSGYG